MNRIVVLGSTGMLGHKMVERLRLHYSNVTGLSRNDGLDPTHSKSVQELLLSLHPDIVINCVGVIKQRPQDVEESVNINAAFPHFLYRGCMSISARLIHFSTDCVFSGKKGNYSELDTPDPEDIYGMTKYLGEVAGVNALTIRTSIIGREKSNYHGLLEWFLRQRGEIPGYRRVMFSGVTTNYLSDIVAEQIKDPSPISGLYQVPSYPVSKFRLLRIFQEVYNRRNIQIIPVDDLVCDRSLRGDKFQQATGIGLRDPADLILEQYEQDKGTYAF
jgi:dTDP-4-dehydrorhamnose reductase